MSQLTTSAAICRKAGAPWEITQLTLDEPKDGEVLIRVVAAGLCHSDEHIRLNSTGGNIRYPIIGGHEGGGVVEQVGPNVSRVAVGDHVACSYIPVCGTCRYCSTGRQGMCDAGLNATTGKFLDGTYRFHSGSEDVGGMCTLGTFSQYVVVSQWSCVKVPDHIPFEVAALVSCGVPTGWGSSAYVAGVRAGDTVVIFGAGGVGSNAVQGAAYAGAGTLVVVDPVVFKRDNAMTLGATHTFGHADDAFEFVRETTWGQLADHAVITVGEIDEEVISQATRIVGKGGQVTITSAGPGHVNVPSGMLMGYGRRVQGAIFGGCNPLYDIPRLLRLYEKGDVKIEELITRRYRLDELTQGYDDMYAGRNIRGVLLHDS
jgi:NDMA-dependent alcohol dehydrogenase